MLKLFNSTDKVFSSNGEKTIKPKRAKVYKKDNGSFYLDLQLDLSYIDDIVKGKIIVAPTPQGEQAFRIGDVEKSRKVISVQCKHVYFDSENYLIEDSYVVDKNCNDALDHLNSATSDTSPFSTISDITTIASFRCVRKSLKEAFETVLERWGGHLVRDNFIVGVRANIGQDNGILVQYKKNLKDITCKEDWTNVVTRLMPVGKDGVLLPEKYVTSNVQYDIPYTKCVSFEQSNIVNEDYVDENGSFDEEAYQIALIEDLRIQAQNYVNENCIPKLNYTLKANLEKITDVGDTIEVNDDRLNIAIRTNLISYEYDCILEKYTELEFGNFKKKISDLTTMITNNAVQQAKINTDNVETTLLKELSNATNKIRSVMGSSYVIYDGDKILILDRLPKEEAQDVIMINNGGIGFGHDGINGNFESTWTIDGTLDMQQINVINLVADMIKGGILKLGSNLNQHGSIEIYDESNTLIGKIDKNGIRTFKNGESYNSLLNHVGTYYRDGDTILGQTTKDGSKFKDMDLFGVYRYGKNSIDDEPMFIAQLYTDSNNEECFGHFWNGG